MGARPRRTTPETATYTSRTKSSGIEDQIFSSCLAQSFPIDLIWDEPSVAGCLRRLASFTRLIVTDYLGCGSSDAVPINDNPAMQSWTDGLVAVLDAVGSDHTSIFAITAAGLPAMMLAASHPQRVDSLLLWSTFARFITAPDQSFGFPEPALPSFLERFVAVVGTGATMDRQAPSWSGDAAKRRWWARNERLSGGPGHWKSGTELFARTDVRPVLGSIQAPTLVMCRRGVRDALEHSAALAQQIPDARLVEFDGDDSVWFAGDADSVLDEVETFLTGQRGAPPSNRVLSTVLFTDIVESTQRAAQLGDDAWTSVLAAHDRLIERHVSGWRGDVVKFTGDGALATFDGPARAIECACAVRDAVENIGLSIRVGLHTGEIETSDGDIHGIAVHVTARIMGLAGPGEVLVSGVIPPLVLGSRIAFDDRGSHELKGVPDTWQVFAVKDSRA